ncbi:hypothetical protein BDQ94DRAFT_146008 [Aspergillus welwitschiae]|uniref:Uncharacterized protein n=1 Tax=Aspergillus welwitschiae TaxID=1341132 RepID=A0A3F3PZV0_9EURO|nr:hypothetical protein BDQ94DRAFT_146008 [Aspergillus welwitschiae]RDH31906.1 hypothetical protein BDQ94DRAFT_146008 [Aspergillus welwitschiae]
MPPIGKGTNQRAAGGVVNGKGKRPQTEWRWRCCWQIDEALYGMEPLVKSTTNHIALVAGGTQ